MYGLFGKMQAQPGQRDALVSHLLRAAEMLRDMDGCYLYVINLATDDPDGIWVNEVWRSQAAHQDSLKHEVIQQLIAVARPLIAAMPERIEVTPLGGKGVPNST
jgi:quinol monooxygenase YgiN